MDVWEILEAAQTSDGRWYPRLMQNNGRAGRCFRFELDTTGPIDERIFDWPSGVPMIGKPDARTMTLP